MNINEPVSSIMTTTLHTIGPKQKLAAVRDTFKYHRIHHIPVLEDEKLIGILSKSDYLYCLKSIDPESREQYQNDIRLKNYSVEEIMTKRIVTASPDDTIRTILELFDKNIYHAIPLLKDDKLVGIVTTYDIIHHLLHPKNKVKIIQQQSKRIPS